MMWRGMANFRPWREGAEERRKEQLDREIREKKLRVKRIKRLIKEERNKKFRSRMAGIEACIESIDIEGLARTKDHLVIERVQEFFKVETFQDIIYTTKKVQTELKGLGCFRAVNILLDTAHKHENNTSYKVKIKVEELGRTFANFGLIDGKQNEICLVLRGGLNNLQGGGERLEISTARGSDASRDNSLTLTAPLHFAPQGSEVMISMNESHESLTNAPIHQTSRSLTLGSRLGYSTTSYLSSHGTRLNTSLVSRLGLSHFSTSPDWKLLSANSEIPRWHPSLELVGDKLLPTLQNIFSFSMLDSTLLPSKGIRATLSHTLGLLPWSGLPSFQQIKLGISTYLPVAKSVSFSCSGYLSHTSKHTSHDGRSDQVPLCYLTQNRSSLVFRGADIPPDYTGDLSAAVYHLSLTSKLPFLQSNAMLCKHTRFHTFLTGHAHRNSPKFNFSMADFRHYLGFGLVGKISDIGRFEINYSLPVRQDGSASKPRLSFAFGTDFL